MEFRLPEGGRIDRTRPLAFRFNGVRLEGCAGDTLASALIANGRHLVARSFKYHRPRGIMTAGVEEPGALVQLGRGATTVPNLKATEIELFEGLEAESVNCWPSVAFDLNAMIGWFAGLAPAGFYYKTFMPSQRLWMRLFEPAIRRAAGWGRAPDLPDPDHYDHGHVHCDVLVVGGGPAGLGAALEAARTGARVILADEQVELGGALLSLRRRIDGLAAADWVGARARELCALDEVRVLTRTTVFGYYHHNYLCALERRADRLGGISGPADPRMRLWHMRARQVVLATGAHERPLVFADNDRPGTMLAGAAQSYVNRYAALPGRRAVLFTNNDGAYEAALDLAAVGAEIAAIVDIRADPAGPLPGAARAAGVEILTGSAVTAVRGRARVAGVEVGPLSPDRRSAGRRIACDLLLVSGGWSPVVHLFSQSQGTLAYDAARACFVPDAAREATHWAGAIGGTFDLAGALGAGAAAGARAAAAAGFGNGRPTKAGFTVDEPMPGTIEASWLVPSRSPAARRFVDFQNDTTAADIGLAAREGFESVEHMKRYTLAGFGTDQGKTGNVNALAILSGAVGRSIAETGTTTFRPPYTPVPFGAMAGRDIGRMNDPVRVTPMHDRHVAARAVFEDVGQWKRPWCFPRAGETMQEAVDRECLAVRDGVGLLDASTLGKIDIRGPDAATLLERVYTNRWSDLAVGRVRYGVMCREDGMVFDDGTTTRLGEHHYLMTTTTGGAAAVHDWLEDYLQTEWPELDVYCTPVTEQWANVTVSGPLARAALGPLCPGLDLHPAAFPFMSAAEGVVAGIPARIFRVSFSGELAYEINVAWWWGPRLWDALLHAGRDLGIAPYGTEAMHVLRAEKGFIIVGQDSDGSQTPHDLGLGRLVAGEKGDFIGKRSFARADTTRPGRKQLVGLRTEDPAIVLPEGAQLVLDPERPAPVPMIGHVTSSYRSACLGHSIALALVEDGPRRLDERVFAPLEHGTVAARIVAPAFYDPGGARRDG